MPRTLHKVSTILSKFAGFMNKLSASVALPRPRVRFAYSAAVPMPRPAARVPNDTILPILDEGTVRCLELDDNYNIVSFLI